MKDLQEFYTQRRDFFDQQIDSLNQKLFLFSLLRLAVFALTVVCVYVAWFNTKFVIGILIVALPLFLFLVSRYSDLKYQKAKKRELKNLNSLEIQVLQRDYSQLSDGAEFQTHQHYFSQDIDLFGEGSFYQITNRTQLKEGGQFLADVYKENDIATIQLKQKAITEMGENVDWRQEFAALAALTETETPVKVITDWLKTYIPFVPKVMKIIPIVFSVLSVALFAFYFADVVPESFLLFWLVFGIIIVGLFSKKIMRLGQDASQLKATFDQYHQLLEMIEEAEFSSEILKKQKANILSNGERNSKVLKRFATLLGNLDRNNNMVYIVVANGFFLRALTDGLAIENWVERHGKDIETWFKTIAFFDAYSSLGNFAFNHPHFNYPEITDGKVVLEAKNAGHPLLNPSKSVLNTISIEQGQFFIITGANMAGKSTFLRTVSLQIMMANVGLPVCAEAVRYSPIKLITSMRTTDSLTDDESYFFSELKRLRFIVDEIQKDRYFIVLDEILKGTNSTDKALGSRKFLERLVKSRSTGIIATHDLSLCEVAKEYAAVKNHYFDAEIVDNELHFDYTFKEGVCQNMNASFLLKKMGIVE